MKTRLKVIGMIALAVVFAMSFTTTVSALDEITVGYYPGWPCSYQVGQAKGWFEKEMGIKVNFREFDHPSQMATALVSGDMQIAYSLGSIPFTSGVSQGVPYKLIGIAVSYSENDNCVARNGSGIKKIEDLRGKNVGVPFSSVSHYKLLATLERFGIKQDEMNIYDMAPQDITAAFKRRDLDCGCAWEPAVSSMLEDGHIIVSAKEQEKWGLKVFDIVVTHNDFAKKHGDIVTKFLQVVDKSTKYYRANRDESAKLIAQISGLEPAKAKDILSRMEFFTKEEQLSKKWLGTSDNKGEVVDFLSGVSKFLLKEKAMDKTLDDYGSVVDPSMYEAVKD